MDESDDEESPEERMARIIGPRAEHEELNRRKELKRRLCRRAVRYRQWLIKSSMDKLRNVANPINNGQEPTELQPNHQDVYQQLNQDSAAIEFRRVVQEETEQFMLQSSSQQSEDYNVAWFLRVVEEIPVPFSWKERVLQWRSATDNMDKIIIDEFDNSIPPKVLKKSYSMMVNEETISNVMENEEPISKILKKSDSIMENNEEIRPYTPPKNTKNRRKRPQVRRTSLRFLAKKNGYNDIELVTLL